MIPSLRSRAPITRHLLCAFAAGSLSVTEVLAAPKPGSPESRSGDEIVAAGRFFHTGTPVVLWMDPGGYDAYRVERRFSDIEKSTWDASKAEVKDLSSPNRFGLRRAGLSAEELEKVRGGGWDLPTLQKVVDQFVIHYDACGTSRQCFKVLHDVRDLSVHFLLDLDGTIYQTLDLKERAWHATISNSRSIGIEIANIGAYGSVDKSPLAEWYAQSTNGSTRITLPGRVGGGGIRTQPFNGQPARPMPIAGKIQRRDFVQYDFTPEQYHALVRLTATLCKVFPLITCDYPKDESGQPIWEKLPDERLSQFHGLLGHWHIQAEKFDPGPAFQWDRVVTQARRLLNDGFSEMADQVSLGHMRSRQ